MSLAELELSVRATNCLESEGITTVRDLVIRTDEELLEVRNFGETTLKEVKSKLQERGLHLGMKLPGFAAALTSRYFPRREGSSRCALRACMDHLLTRRHLDH